MKQLNFVLILMMVVFLLIPIFLPNHIEQKLEYEIEAPIGLVFDEFSELENFSKWEKFTQNDTLVTKTFSDSEDNISTTSEWKSNSSAVGNGKIKIVDFEVNRLVEYSFKFENWEKEDHLKFEFALLPSGNTKVIAYYISQEVPYFYRYFLFFNSPINKLDNSIESFKELIKIRLNEERKGGNLIYGEFKVVKLEKQTLMAIKKNPTNAIKEIDKAVDESLETIYKSLMDEEGSYDFDLGFPHVYTTEYNQSKNTRTIFTGIKLLDDMPIPKGMQRVNIGTGNYLLALHQGSRYKKSHTLDLMKNYAKSNNIVLENRELEVFLTDPKETDSIQLKSRIYIPIKTN